MKHWALAFVVSILTAAPAGMLSAAAHGSTPMAAAAVNVTVSYKGAGRVDASHRLWVWLFSSPDIGPGSMPIAQLSFDKNGAVAAFEGLSAERVWVAAAFDEGGTMSGDAPPPPGTPIGLYAGSDGRPKPVTAGETVSLTFDDSLRMP